MPLILNIDTSTEKASICIARDGLSMFTLENAEQKDHAAWMHPAIKKLLQQLGCTITDLNAVAITGGPGSYTGIRVAMATAKGLCYALNIPLIIENTLRVMAFAAKRSIGEQTSEKGILFAPMLDARRMEVFTALFDPNLQEVVKSCATELAIDTFSDHLEINNIFFSGSGSKKFERLVRHGHAHFVEVQHTAAHLAELSGEKFQKKDFSDVAYTEPLYLKEFYTQLKK